MKPHPRIRKTIKWGGAVVTVLLGVVWIGSLWWLANHTSPFGNSEQVGCGAVWIVRSHSPNAGIASAIFQVRRHSEQPVWTPVWGSHGMPGGWYLRLPLWLPMTFLVAITLAAWRVDTLARRRARLNLCPKCNYDRTGLRGGAGAVCPECGALPSSPKG